MASHMLISVRLLILVALAFSQVASAYDPSPLQDFCVADSTAKVFVNGFTCKNPADVMAEDFFFSGLDRAGDTNNRLGVNVTTVNVVQIPGLNTLGVSMVRIDFAPKGLNPPHLHPRATEILTVLEGKLAVGFITSNQADGGNRLVSKILNKGDVFVFPIGLIHFQVNVGRTKAVSISGLGSQNAGVITVANALFGSDPSIDANVLAKAFQLKKAIVDDLLAKF